MNAYVDAMRRYFDFKGRTGRGGFWMFTLVFFVVGVLAVIMDAAIGNGVDGPPFITALWVIPHYIPALAVTVRRLHDIDRSGWWVLIGLVPAVGWIVQLVFSCQPSTPGANRFGPGPDGGLSGIGNLPTVDHRQVEPEQAHSAATLPAGAQTGSVAGHATVADIERLAALRAAGVIDDAEMARLKAKIIAQGGA